MAASLFTSARGLHHLHGRHARPFFFGPAHGYRGGLPGYGYWGDIGDYWDWGGMPAGYDPAPTAGLGRLSAAAPAGQP